MRNVVAALLVLMLTACASSRGFDRGALRGQIPEQKQVAEEDIQKVLGLKPQLPSPFTLAIYFVSPPPGSCYGNSWIWLSEDKDTLQSLEAELKGKGILSEVFVISNQIVEESDNLSIRLAAARAGADAVLIVNGVSDIDRYNNPLGYTYFLLITPFFIPGTEADGLFMANATMWDVRNQYLYLSAEAEGTAKEIKPAVFIDEKRIIKSAKSAALATLKAEISSRLIRMSTK